MFGTVFFGTFWRLCKLVFRQKNFQNVFIIYFFIQKTSDSCCRKTSITQVWLFVESCPTTHWVMFVTFIDWFMIYRFIWLIWFWHELPSYNFVKRPASKIQGWYLKCSLFKNRHYVLFILRPADSNWLIIVELKRKVEYN